MNGWSSKDEDPKKQNEKRANTVNLECILFNASSSEASPEIKIGYDHLEDQKSGTCTK